MSWSRVGEVIQLPNIIAPRRQGNNFNLFVAFSLFPLTLGGDLGLSLAITLSDYLFTIHKLTRLRDRYFLLFPGAIALLFTL